MNQIKLRYWMLILASLLLVLPAQAQDDAPETFPPETFAADNGMFVTLAGADVYVETTGNPDEQAVILLHGFGGSTFTWRDALGILGDSGYYAIAYDRPPFGLSEKSADVRIDGEAQVERLAALMDELEIESAVLVGHSAGGGVISRFVTAYPERVAGLVYVAGVAPLPPDDDETAEDESGSPLGGLSDLAANIDTESEAFLNLLTNFLTRERFLGILESAYDPAFEVSDEIRDGYAQILQVDDWQVGLAQILTQQETSDPIDPATFAQAVEGLPVTLIWGENDTWVPLSRGEALAELVPNAELIAYAGVGHLPMEEAPEQFIDDLIAFLMTINDNNEQES